MIHFVQDIGRVCKNWGGFSHTAHIFVISPTSAPYTCTLSLIHISYHIAMPQVVKVWLTGRLAPMVSAQDVILQLLLLFSMTNTGLYVLCLVGVMLAFALIYTCLLYTSRCV